MSQQQQSSFLFSTQEQIHQNQHQHQDDDNNDNNVDDDGQQQQQQEIVRKMLQMKQQYQKLKQKYQHLKKNKSHHNHQHINNTTKRQQRNNTTKITKKQSHNHNNTTSQLQTQTISKNNHYKTQSSIQQQSFIFNQSQQSSISSHHNGNNTFNYQPSIHHSNTQLDSFQFHQQTSHVAKKQYKVTHNQQESFTYKSSTAQQSFQYQPSNLSLLLTNLKSTIQQKNNYQTQPNQSSSRSFSFQQSEILSKPKNNQSLNNITDSFSFHNDQFIGSNKNQQKQKISKNRNQSSISYFTKNESSLQNDNTLNVPQQQQVLSKKINNQKQRKKIEISSDASYEPSQQSNGQNFEYNLREFSFQIPENILDPFEIKDSVQLIIKNHKQPPKKQPQLETKTKNKQKNNTPPTIQDTKNLQLINQAYDDQYESQQQQELFLKKLINKLNMRKKISVKQIKVLSQQIKLLAQKNQQIVQIFQTGTYQLDYIQEGSHIDWYQSYYDKVNSWKSRVLITQLSFCNKINLQKYHQFFQNIQLPALQQITIKIQDSLSIENGNLIKKPAQNFSIQFLKYNGLSKKLKTLSLRGQTMPIQLAKNLVDLDFPYLKSLYLGFQTYFTDQIITMLTCTKFVNMPKCTVYIASWEGEIDYRFRWVYEKIKFIPLQEGEQDLSFQSIKYRAKSINLNQMFKKHHQSLGQGLENYFESQKNMSSQVK